MTYTTARNAEVYNMGGYLVVRGPGVNHAIAIEISEGPVTKLNNEDLNAFFNLDEVAFSENERTEFELYMARVAECGE